MDETARAAKSISEALHESDCPSKRDCQLSRADAHSNYHDPKLLLSAHSDLHEPLKSNDSKRLSISIAKRKIPMDILTDARALQGETLASDLDRIPQQQRAVKHRNLKIGDMKDP